MLRKKISYNLLKCTCRNNNTSYNLQKLSNIDIRSYACLVNNYINFIRGRSVFTDDQLDMIQNQVLYSKHHNKYMMLKFSDNPKELNANTLILPGVADSSQQNLLAHIMCLEANMDFIDFINLHVYDFNSMYCNSILKYEDNLKMIVNSLK